jgi:hypothetical protein
MYQFYQSHLMTITQDKDPLLYISEIHSLN